MSELSPYAILVGLAEKARGNALALPESYAAQTHATGLGFNLLDQRFVASMDEVVELMRLPPTTRVPGVKEFVLGVGNVRGRLMTVIDLAVFFGEVSLIPNSQRRVMAVEDGENLIGFVIDFSSGMQHFPSDAFIDQPVDVPELFAEFVRGGYQVAGVQWPVLSLSAIAGDSRLAKLAMVH